jgi:hypothetical protein
MPLRDFWKGLSKDADIGHTVTIPLLPRQIIQYTLSNVMTTRYSHFEGRHMQYSSSEGFISALKDDDRGRKNQEREKHGTKNAMVRTGKIPQVADTLRPTSTDMDSSALIAFLILVRIILVRALSPAVKESIRSECTSGEEYKSR